MKSVYAALLLSSYWLLGIILSSSLCSGQVSNYFDVIHNDSINLSTSDSIYVSNIVTLPSVGRYKYVKANDFGNHYSNGFITLNDPLSDGDDWLIYTRDIQFETNKSFTLFGQIHGSDESIMLHSDSNGLGGIIELDSQIVNIYPIDSCLSLYVEHSGVYDHRDFCSVEDTASGIQSTPCPDNDCAALVKVLVLVTSQADDWINGNGPKSNRITPFISSAVESVNFVFERSNINHRIWAEVVDFSWNHGNTVCGDAKDLSLNSNAQQLRNDYGADLVVMLTDFDYSGSDDHGCVAGNSDPPNSADAYSIVLMQYALSPSYVFAHELGHLFACQHERFHPRQEGCPYGWEVIPNFKYTVMSVNAPRSWPGANTSKIPNFSDPDINWYNYPTGNNVLEDEADCAGQIRSIGCTVAGHEGPTELSVIIEGISTICSGTETYTTNIEEPPIGQPGQPPYLINWYWNNDGLFSSTNLGTFIGSGTTITIPPPNIPTCSFIFLRAVVTAQDGTEGYATKRVSTYPCQSCTEPQLPGPPPIINGIKDQIFEIYPSPSFGNVTLRAHGNKKN